MEKQHLVPGDSVLIENIVSYLKAKGIFDEFRHECLADVDTKSSCQNLSQRVDGYTTKFLSNETWNPDMNKNELRNKLRRHIDESGMLAVGADHVVEQVINPKIHQLFLPRIIEVVHQYLNEENEKIKKKEKQEETSNIEKTSTEITDASPIKAKTTVLDPIADILSFTYSKPKPISTSTPNTQPKGTETTVKVEKRKDDAVVRKDEPVSQKKKEDSSVPVKCPVIEKKEEELSDIQIKIEPPESIDENVQSVTASQSKVLEAKDLNKVKKELKTDDLEGSLEIQKKVLKDDTKVDKKKMDDIKLQISDGIVQQEETVVNKTSATASKPKQDSEKSKKVKSHSPHKLPLALTESRKKLKESSDSSSTKSSTEKPAKGFSKASTSKDPSSPFKSGINSKTVKCEKDDSSKSKSSDVHLKSPDPSLKKVISSKSSFVKKEVTPSKVKHSSNKIEKLKTHKIFALKADPGQQDSPEKVKKSSIQYSSSYESSQGSDQDRSSSSVSSKHKHFSKHLKKEDSKASERIVKSNTDKKRPHSDLDSGIHKKYKSGKISSKHLLEKQKKPTVTRESAKIESRSNSLGSSSSISDSQTSSSKENLLSTSEDTSDNTAKQPEKKKSASKNGQCRNAQNFPPPPPPPPSASLGVGTSSAEMSSMDETQSSQESESESESSSEDFSNSDSDSGNNTNNSLEASLTSRRALKTPDLLNDIYDVFLYSSSSSEFEGYSSPEKNQRPVRCNKAQDVNVSSVHTTDLSSFDDELSLTDQSDSESEGSKVKRKLTLKEAEDLLRARKEKQSDDKSKDVSLEVTHDERKLSNSSLRHSTSVLYSEDEVTSRLEPKRESRRERKLNPKYASNEYASIFNSKKASFITKQTNQTDDKQSSVHSPDVAVVKKSDTNSPGKSKVLTHKPLGLSSKKGVSHDVENKLSNDDVFEPSSSIHFSECPLIQVEPVYESHPAESKMNSGIQDKSHSTLTEIDSHNRIALKIKTSASKTDNQTNKETNRHGVKRKCSGEKDSVNKRTCVDLDLNCINSRTTEPVANENTPFNNKTNNSAIILSVEEKDFFHIQNKANSNGINLNKTEHMRKNSLSKPNHVAEKKPGD